MAPADQTAAEQDQSSEFSLAAPVPSEDRAFVERHIFSEKVRLLYRFSLAGYLAELVVTFLLGALLWNDLGERPELFAWFAAAKQHGIKPYDWIGLSYYTQWSKFDLVELKAEIEKLKTTFKL